MKRCPTCKQTFSEDWLSFCPQDGAVLVDDAEASREPLPTVSPPPTQPATPDDQATWNFSAGSQLPQQPAWQPPPPPSYAQPQNNGLAIASMIVGIVSLLCLGPIFGTVAIILGAVALSQIKKNPDTVGGKPFAVTGVVTGSVSVVICGGVGILYIVMMAIGAASH